MAMDIQELFNSCAALESKVAQLYYLFAEQSKEIPELSALWSKTASEEENHMQQFQFAARLARSTELLMLVDGAEVKQVSDTISRLTEKISQNPPGWRASLRFAIDLEEKLAKFHMDTAAIYVDQRINDLFKAMMTNDEQHVQSLGRYLEQADNPAL